MALYHMRCYNCKDIDLFSKYMLQMQQKTILFFFQAVCNIGVYFSFQ